MGEDQVAICQLSEQVTSEVSGLVSEIVRDFDVPDEKAQKLLVKALSAFLVRTEIFDEIEDLLEYGR